MDILAVVSVLIGIVTGLLVLAEKILGIFSRIKHYKKMFDKYYNNWKESGHEFLPSHNEFRKVLKYIEKSRLTKDELAFSLLCALQYGDKSLNYLIERNMNNKKAIAYTIEFLSGKGIRVKWRAEYALSKFPQSNVKSYIEQIKECRLITDEIKESFQRILTQSVEEYLINLSKSTDQRMKDYSSQVIGQIQAGIVSAKLKKIIQKNRFISI
ncbi:MAG: hypothetical protein H0Z29_10515 [Candidatus Marinimicrobia bacterium]|nr:hypothetical protein [Candidatus Neomarinimicrobiota bacterium]